MEKEFILASNNKNKYREFSKMLEPFGIKVAIQKEAGYDIDVEETGTTFAENATQKAEAIYNLAKKPVIADDSGLVVDFLNGEPGIYSARYAGPDASDDDKINKVLNKMKEAKSEAERSARFKCAICYIDENGKKNIFEGACEGYIATEKHGDNGFGYDPIFMVGDKSFAELTVDEKAMISHRGNATRLFLQVIKEQFGEKE